MYSCTITENENEGAKMYLKLEIHRNVSYKIFMFIYQKQRHKKI